MARYKHIIAIAVGGSQAVDWFLEECSRLSLEVDASYVGFPSAPVLCHHHYAYDPIIAEVVDAYIVGTNPLREKWSDDDIFSVLGHHFSCNEESLYNWLVFTAYSETTVEMEDASEDEEGELYGLMRYRLRSAYDTQTGVEKVALSYPATKYFSERFLQTVSGIIIAANIARPGSLLPKVAVSYVLEVTNEYIALPTATARPMHNIGDLFIRYASEPVLNLEDIWQWMQSMTGVVDGVLVSSKVGRALNVFAHFFAEGDAVLKGIAALEVLYTQGRDKKLEQLRTNIPLVIDTSKLFPNQDFKKIINNLYDIRSRISHGDRDIENPFRPSCEGIGEDIRQTQDYIKAAFEVRLLLTETLRVFFSKESKEN